jgi:hypothetical protein
MRGDLRYRAALEGAAGVAADPGRQSRDEAACFCPFRKSVGVQPSYALKTVAKC